VRISGFACAAVVACAAIVLVSPRALAQSSAAPSAVPEWKAWASLSIGPAAVNGEGLPGGMIALWATHNEYAFSLRAIGASRLFEVGDVTDFSILAGLHTLRTAHADAVFLAGAGMSYGHSTATGDRLVREPVLAGSAQLNFNYVFVGAGLDAFVGVGPTRRYYGVGLSLALGAFQ